MTDGATEQGSWYEIVADDPVLQQGDIISGCPVFRPNPNLSHPINPEDENAIEFPEDQSVIVLTQSCDLQPRQKKHPVFVVLCGVESLPETPYSKDQYGLLQLTAGRMHGLHLLAECHHEPWNGSQLVVSFKDVWTLPLPFLMSYVASLGPRLRLVPPYRELLSQRFGYYFSRIATPVDLPRIDISNKERNIVDFFVNAGPEVQQRILACFNNEVAGKQHDSPGTPQLPSICDRFLKILGLKRLRE
jgi:hypothetical protein